MLVLNNMGIIVVHIKHKRAVSINLIFYHKRTIKIHLNVQDTKWKGELIRRNDFILIQPRLRKSNGEAPEFLNCI